MTRTLRLVGKRDRWLPARAVDHRPIRDRSAHFAVAAARRLGIMLAILLVLGLMLALVAALTAFSIVLALSVVTTG